MPSRLSLLLSPACICFKATLRKTISFQAENMAKTSLISLLHLISDVVDVVVFRDGLFGHTLLKTYSVVCLYFEIYSICTTHSHIDAQKTPEWGT